MESSWPKKFTEFFLPEEAHGASEMDQKSPEATMRVECTHYHPGRTFLPCGCFVDPPDLFPTPTPLIYPQTSRTEPRSGVPPPQASVATKNQSGPYSGTLPEGESITSGHLHHPDALHDEEGVVHPRGWGYVPVAMCLISLSLSLSCSWLGTILMYRELCYYSWILWCSSLSTFL